MSGTVVIGIDGAGKPLLDRYIADGSLPTFAALARKGVYTTLLSTLHPNTPLAWTTLFSGVNAGKHGLFDFRTFDLLTKKFRFTTSIDRKVPLIWEFPEVNVRKSLVINLPLTYPPTSLTGLMIAGMNSPGIGQACYPAHRLEEILEIEPEYRIDMIWKQGMDDLDFQIGALATIEARARVIEGLFERDRPELTIAVFTTPDRLQHRYWHTWEDKDSVIRRSYILIDAFLSRLLELIDKNGQRLFIVSDHGFQKIEADFYPNNLLRAYNMLKFIGDPNNIAEDVHVQRGFQFIDWERTLWYSYGYFGSIFFNDIHTWKGRFDEPQRSRLVDSFVECLKESPWHERIDRIIRREELFHGPFLDRLPDILLVADGYRSTARDGSEFRSGKIFDEPSLSYTGTHAREGIFLAYGKGIAGQDERSVPDIFDPLDLVPVVLAALDCPIPSLCDGRLPGWLFGGETTLRTIELPENDFYRSHKAFEGSEVDRSRITKQLHGLGYL